MTGREMRPGEAVGRPANPALRVANSVGWVRRGVFRQSGALFSMPNSSCGQKPGVLSRPRSFHGQPNDFGIERRGFSIQKILRAIRQMPLPVANRPPHAEERARHSENRSARRTERIRRSDFAARRSDGRGPRSEGSAAGSSRRSSRDKPYRSGNAFSRANYGIGPMPLNSCSEVG